MTKSGQVMALVLGAVQLCSPFGRDTDDFLHTTRHTGVSSTLKQATTASFRILCDSSFTVARAIRRGSG
jgi:hypothetical protein